MKYKIKVTYITGDSFNTTTTSDFIELKWNDLSMAKESLQRIKSHHEFYKKNDDMWHKPDCDLPLGVYWNDEYRFVGLNLIDDDKNEYSYCANWCGHFETLLKAEIFFDDNDLKYIP